MGRKFTLSQRKNGERKKNEKVVRIMQKRYVATLLSL